MTTTNRKTTRPRGPMLDYRPRPPTLVLIEAVRLVLDEYAAYLPLTLRQVFYRLIGAYGYPKTKRFSTQLQEALVKARRAGLIPLGDIRDDGITVEDPGGFDGVPSFDAYIAELVRSYRRDRLIGQDVAVELWAEAAGMVPQLAGVARDYGVPVYSGSGFDSLPAKTDAAWRAVTDGRPRLVLHIGDYDPSGVHVFKSAAEDVPAWAEHWDAEVSFERIAVTPLQIVEYGLETADLVDPSVYEDSGYTPPSFDGTQTCQAEALNPADLAAIVTAAIERHIDTDELARLIEVEAEERAELIRRYGA